MQTVTSKDGTKIAFDKVGSGPAVILVNGAIAYRAFDPSMAQLAELLGKYFTVYNYDRRGRGDSGDTQPFTKEREIEDLQALVEDAVGNVMQGKPLPTDRWVKVTVPVLVADGGASDAWVHHAADALAKVLPHASRQTLAGQIHMVDPNVLAPVIIEFLKK